MKPSRLILFSLTLVCCGQDSDSREIKKTVTDFYSWYLNAIESRKRDAFEPQFVSDQNGMTTLKMDNYLANLEKHHFSKDLIERERSSYDKCIDNLRNIPFKDFETKYTDLDQFETMDCAFGNYYRWTGSQEPIEAVKITSLKIEGPSTATVVLNYYDPKVGDASLWGHNEIKLIKINRTWYIDNIDWRNP